MNKVPILLFYSMFFVVFFQIPAYCQTTYSLYELTQLANKHSETIKIAQEDVYIANQDKARALSVLIPRATAYGRLTEYKNDDISIPDTLTLGVKLTQSFTLNGKELIALDVTKTAIEGKQFSLESIRSQYLLQVSQAYYNILSAQRFVEIALSDVNRLSSHRDAVKEKLSVGNVTKTDLYRAEAELSKSLTEQVRAENRMLQSKAALHNLVEIEDDFTLQKDDIGEIENYEITLGDIQIDALNNRSEIKEAKKNLEITKKTIKFKKSDYWPTLELEAGYKETDIKYDFGPTTVEDDTNAAYIMGELMFTLYDGGLRKAEIRQALADHRKAADALTLQEKAIILDSKISFLDYKTAKSALLNLQDELKFARENFNAVQMQFKYGMADSIDMMDANTLLVSAQRRSLDAKYTYYLSVLKILYTKGDLLAFLLKQA
ncbi:TolC family protein [Desulfobacula toluolica]|uniref:Outer membrane efflux protein, TolC-like n=1 Tax=Desulfobacula toluolica (strain DSM 7467 / Tol2) TaxID=651182 RepID=K0NGS2_DESTT|nr:TolC family protein [Desulfobacula toluolica]CCK80150.1 outer membrane efflux protein, TolC-like [Desulfobacula toluolica Tol2]